jgi:hypothetical protein
LIGCLLVGISLCRPEIREVVFRKKQNDYYNFD